MRVLRGRCLSRLRPTRGRFERAIDRSPHDFGANIRLSHQRQSIRSGRVVASRGQGGLSLMPSLIAALARQLHSILTSCSVRLHALRILRLPNLKSPFRTQSNPHPPHSPTVEAMQPLLLGRRAVAPLLLRRPPVGAVAGGGGRVTPHHLVSAIGIPHTLLIDAMRSID